MHYHSSRAIESVRAVHDDDARELALLRPHRLFVGERHHAEHELVHSLGRGGAVAPGTPNLGLGFRIRV